MDDETFDYESHKKKQKAADENMKKVEEDTKNWLATNKEVQSYFTGFGKYWADDFISRYPAMKAMFTRYGNELGDQPEKNLIAYMNTAGNRLMDVQLKKLFDVICQWDARLLELDDVVCSYDFMHWQDDIANCPFITPLTNEEVQLYLKFINTDDFEKEPYISLSCYTSYRSDDEQYDRMPAWFLFENIHTGNNKYLTLPMLRTEKEHLYRVLWRREEDEKIEKKYQSGELQRYVADDRPQISIHTYRDVEQFIMRYENKDTLLAFRKYYAYFTDQLIRDNAEDEHDGWLTEKVQDIIHHLTGVKEKIPIEAGVDWREALIEAYKAYETRKIKEAITYAYSDYKMKQELKIDNPARGKQSDYVELAKNVRNQILRGRELNGEPKDFDY